MEHEKEKIERLRRQYDRAMRYAKETRNAATSAKNVNEAMMLKKEIEVLEWSRKRKTP